MASKQVSIRLTVDGDELDIKLTKYQLKVVQASADMGAALANLARSSKASMEDAAKGVNKLGSSAAHGVTSVQALGGAIRGLDGSMNVRAAERFLASFSGLANVAKAVFPVFGALAIVDIFGAGIEKAQKMHEEFQRLRDMASQIKIGFQGINTPLEIANSELNVANDKLQQEINKLSGKPSNGLKLALDEAIASSEKLSKSLGDNLNEVQKLLKDNSVGFFQGAFSQQMPTTGASDAVKAEQKRVGNINAGFDLLTPQNDTEKSAVEQARSASLLAVYRQQAADARKQLADLMAKRAASDAAATGEYTGNKTSYYDSAIAAQQGLLRNANENITRYGSTQKNEALTKTKDQLTAGATSDALTRPFLDKTKELAAQIDGLKDKLKSIGADGTAEVLAKAYADWKEELTKLNSELAKHHSQLTAVQSDQLKSQYVTIETTKVEIAWQESFKKSTTSIDEKTASLVAQTQAIGQGYAAQKAFNVEAELATKLGANANDPAWMKAHAGNVSSLRSSLGTQYDAQTSQKTDETLDQLQTQIELENALANAQANGSEAVREATLQQQLATIAKDKSTESAIKLIGATAALAAAQENGKSKAAIANLQFEIEATNRLTAGQLGGAAGIRDATLENQIAQFKRSSPAGAGQDAQVALMRQNAAGQRAQSVQSSALQGANAPKDQLANLNEQIAYLKQIQDAGDHSLTTESALKNLEDQRLNVYSNILLTTNSMSDGVTAFMLKMQTQSQTTSSIVYSTFDKAFSGVSDSLAKMVTGGKANFSSLFQGLAESIAKSTIQNGFQKLLGGLFSGGSNLAQDAFGGGVVASGGGGFFSSLLSLFVPHAAGGSTNAGGDYLVGEQGPELMHTGSSGMMYSADKTKAMLSGGGGNTYSYQIDARGANAADVDARVKQSLAAVHQRSVHDAAGLQAELKARSPRSKF